MKRTIAFMLSLIMIVGLLAGCGGSTEPEATPAPQLTPEERAELYKTSIEGARPADENEAFPIVNALEGDGELYLGLIGLTGEDVEAFAMSISMMNVHAYGIAAMKPAGLLDELPENLIDAGSAVAGCGPAFACMFMEALADGGVACGLPRAKALEYAAQMVLGTAQLLLSTGEHPGVLKDQVCSPGGSTMQGVRALEVGGLRGTVMEAVIAAFEKNKEFIR